MGRLEDTEFYVLGNGKHNLYIDALGKAYENSSVKNFDNVRYMMALVYNAGMFGANNDLMFIGGLGVLGNVVEHMGIERINDWRGTHDIDLALKRKDLTYIIDTSFDKINYTGKSLSVKNKLTFKGSSIDADNIELKQTHVDVYVPNGNPASGISIEGKDLSEHHWDIKREVDFFGVKINFLDP